MNMTRSELDALFTVFNTSLNKGLAKEWKGYERWSMVVSSRGGSETYPISLVTGGMREWVGPRLLSQLDTAKLTVLNKDWEHTEAVSRNDIEDDNIGFYAPLFEAMGVDAANLWGKLATQALTNPGDWADGAAFFSSRTLSKKSTVNNKVTGPLTTAKYAEAREQMMGFRDSAGSPLGLIPDLLMVGPSLEGVAKSILEAQLVADSSNTTVSNTHYKEAEVQVNPYLVGGDASKWFLICTNRGLKPVAVQQRKVGALTRYDQEHDLCVKDLNENHYGLHYRGAAAGVQPLLVIGGNL